MDNRALLEHAARASGISGNYVRQHIVYGDEWIEGIDTYGPAYWNPLTDDGDAMRLAVKLEIPVRHHHHGVGWVDAGLFKELIGADPYAATRRAIVRAAAEIGKKMDAPLVRAD